MVKTFDSFNNRYKLHRNEKMKVLVLHEIPFITGRDKNFRDPMPYDQDIREAKYWRRMFLESLAELIFDDTS